MGELVKRLQRLELLVRQPVLPVLEQHERPANPRFFEHAPEVGDAPFTHEPRRGTAPFGVFVEADFA